MFSNLRKRLEDSLDAVEQLATQQIQPRSSFDGMNPSVGVSSNDRRRPAERQNTNSNSAAPGQLAESALSNLRKSLGVNKAGQETSRSPVRDESPVRRESKESTVALGTSRASGGRTLTLEDRLRAKFAIGDLSNSTSAVGTRHSSPAPPSLPPSSSELRPPTPPAVPEPPQDPASVALPQSPILSPSPVSFSSIPDLSHTAISTTDPVIPSTTDESHPSTSYPAPPSPSKAIKTPLPTSPPSVPAAVLLLNDLHQRVASPPLDSLLSTPPSLESAPAEPELDPEKLRERLKLVEQRFSDVSRSFKRIQAEKAAADRVVKALTPLEGVSDVEGLQEHLRNIALKAEMATEEIKRLNIQVKQHDERVEELRDIHKLETKSQSELIETLRTRISEAEVLLRATSQTTYNIESASSAKQGTIDQLKSDLEKLKEQVKDEEDKGTKAISLLKTVRSKLVKAEKEREDATKEKDDMRLERDAARGETAGVRSDIDRLRAERERDVGAIRAQFDKDVSALRERVTKEAASQRGQFELEVITLKAAHTKELNARGTKISQLEASIRNITNEKDSMFEQNQLRQAEVESSQSHLENLTNQNNELRYQLQEANDRIAMLNDEAYERASRLNGFDELQARSHEGSGSNFNPYFPASPSHEPPAEVARLLSEAEGKYEAKLSELRDKIRVLEKERNETEEDWGRSMADRGKEIEKLKRAISDKEREWGEKTQAWSESESKIASLERNLIEIKLDREETSKAVEVLKKELELAKESESSAKEDRQDLTTRLTVLERQLEEFKTRDAQLRAANKNLRDELRKVQNSAALLERQRNPGVGYWSSTNSVTSPRGTPTLERRPSIVTNGHRTLSPGRAASPTPSEGGSTARRISTSSNPNSNSGTADEEGVNLEYLRNVILQFLENEKMRPDLIRVLSIILRFTPQETRRLIAKVG